MKTVRYELNIMARMLDENGEQDDRYPDPDIMREEEYDTFEDAVAVAHAITPEQALRYESMSPFNGLDVFIIERTYIDGEAEGEFDIPYEAGWLGARRVYESGWSEETAHSMRR